MEITQQGVEKVLSRIIHPAYEKDIVSIGLVENIQVDKHKIRFRLVFPQADPLSDTIQKECECAIMKAFPQAEIRGNIMQLVREKASKTKNPADEGYDGFKKVRHIVAVASGKGGVGKSTVAVNLAIALSREGLRVGLIDADIYGPSVPKMTDMENVQPLVKKIDGHDVIIPIQKYEVRWMSIGFFISPEQPMIWRGPMATNALRQIAKQVEWGELDVLLIDLPPGTGDIHLSIIHDIPLSAAIVVSTPQAVALTDVEKGVNMFLHDKVHVPILGLVENMAWFTPEELPNNKYYIFGKDGCKILGEKLNLPLLAQIPIVQSLCESGDDGKPVALLENEMSSAFKNLAQKTIKGLSALNHQ